MPFLKIRRGIQGYPNSYVRLEPDDEVDTAIVFVHGFLGSAETTFFNFGLMVEMSSVGRELWRRSDLYFFAFESARPLITTSSDRLRAFLSHIFPSPPKALTEFNSSPPWSNERRQAKVSATQRCYRHLVIVGHSEGSLIARHALVTIAKRRELNGEDIAIQPGVLNCTLRLFAPAIRGASLIGLLGIVASLPMLNKIQLATLNMARAAAEMQRSPIVEDIRRETEMFAGRFKSILGFRADVVYGMEDNVVFVGEYSCDFRLNNVEHQSHTSICKPDFQFQFPLRFVHAGRRSTVS